MGGNKGSVHPGLGRGASKFTDSLESAFHRTVDEASIKTLLRRSQS